MADKLIYRFPSGTVYTTDGPLDVKQGQELPELADGEEERLRRYNAIAKEGDDLTPPAMREAAEGVAAALAPATVEGTSVTLDVANLHAASDQELAAGVGDLKVSELVDAVGEDAALAERVLVAERTASAGDPRKTLVEQLEKVTGGGG